MKRIFASCILLFTSFSFAQGCTDMLFNKQYPVEKEPTHIICYERFVVGYSTTRKAPLWTAEVLTADNLRTQQAIKRPSTFKLDPHLKYSEQSTLQEFVGTIFDRGHMVPFEDVADSENAANESFFITNIVAQNKYNNRGIWKSLEIKTRKLAEKYGTVYIVTGPIFSKTSKTLSGGTQIADKLFKMILVPDQNLAFTFIIPNIALTANKLNSFITTIDDLKNSNLSIDPLPVDHKFSNSKRIN